jgi:hypothetical protein
MLNETDIYKVIEGIRARINSIEKQAILLTDHAKWLQLTSALDVLADTTAAIFYYLDATYPKKLGGKYLYSYGLLQCLVMQQDAVESISSSLLDKHIDWEHDFPEAFRVREIRNDVVGHPTNRRGEAVTYLVQHSLNKEHMLYLKNVYSSECSDSINDISVKKSVSEAMECSMDVLIKISDHLEREYQCYKDQYKQRKMSKIFEGLGYAAEKVLLKDIPLDMAGYLSSKRMVSECEKELIERYGNIDAFDAFSYKLKQIHEVYSLFDDELTEVPYKTSERIKDCLYQYLFDRLYELENLCKEVDDEFET